MNAFDHLPNCEPDAWEGRTAEPLGTDTTPALPLVLESVTLTAAPGEQAPQVRNLSLRCAAAQVLRVHGLTDAGRDVLFGFLRGITPPMSGRYRLEGKDLWSLGATARTALRLRRIGTSLRSASLLPHLSAQENIALSLLVNDVGSADAMRSAVLELDRFGLASIAGRPPTALNDEERRLTSIAKALAHRPALVVCEYPEEGLSRSAIAKVRARLWHAAQFDRACIVLLTDDPALSELASTTLYLR